MSEPAYKQRLSRAEVYIQELEAQAGQMAAQDKKVLEQALLEFSVILEELYVAEEEIAQQNAELQAVQKALDEERRRYLDLFEFAPDGYLVTDCRGIIQQANRRAAIMLDAAADSLPGKPLVLYIASGERDVFHRWLDRLGTGEPERRVEWETYLKPARREPFPAALAGAPMSDGQGRIVGVRWLLHDITARKQSEVTLQRSEQRLALALEIGEIGVLDARLSPEQDSFHNPRWAEVLGYSPGELAASNANLAWLSEQAHPDDRARFQTAMDDLLAGHVQHSDLEVRLRHQSGRWIDTHLLFHVGERDEKGHASRITATMRDITAQKLAEQALIAAEKRSLVDRLVASLAHEISNPLQAAIGCLELAGEALDKKEDPAEYLDVAIGELERVSEKVGQLRDLNRQAQPQDRRILQLNALLQRTLVLVQQQAQQQGVEVDLHAGENLPGVIAAPDPLQQVFLNLALNALDAMPRGGRLDVETGRTTAPDGVRIAFRDNGPGIAAEVLPRLFDPFNTTKSNGMGLGLYISRGIIQDYQGRIELDNRPGQGATFVVWLPAS